MGPSPVLEVSVEAGNRRTGGMYMQAVARIHTAGPAQELATYHGRKEEEGDEVKSAMSGGRRLGEQAPTCKVLHRPSHAEGTAQCHGTGRNLGYCDEDQVVAADTGTVHSMGIEECRLHQQAEGEVRRGGNTASHTVIAMDLGSQCLEADWDRRVVLEERVRTGRHK